MLIFGKWLVGPWSGICVLLAFSFALGQGELRVGFSQFELEEGSPPPVGTALFRLKNGDGVLVSEAGVAAVLPVREGRVFVQRDQRIDTGIALANPSDQEIGLRISLRDGAGQIYAERDDIVLAPHAHSARFVGELFNTSSQILVPDNFIGSLTFEVLTAGQGVAAVTLRQGFNAYGEPIFTTLPVADLQDNLAAGNDRLIFPQIGVGSGLTTQLMLMNESNDRLEGEVSFFASNGESLSLDYEQLGLVTPEVSSISFEISGNGTFFANLTLPAGTDDVRVGYAVVTITQGSLPSGSAIFRYVDGDREPISEAGVGAISPTKNARLSVGNSGTRTAVAIVNPELSTSQILLTLQDTQGNALSEVTREVIPGGHTALFVDDLFDLEEGFVGLVEMESSTPFVPITLKLTLNARRQPILTTLPVADLENPPEDTLLVFPQFGIGTSSVGEFLTELIFIGPDGENASIGTLSFWEGLAGNPWELEGLHLSSQLSFGVGAGEFGWLGKLDADWDDTGRSASATITPKGGTLKVENDRGDIVILEIPAAALPEPTTITITAHETRPRNNSSYSLFPGVTLEPEGLVFLWTRPKLRIILAEEPTDPKGSAIIWRSNEGYTLPVGSQRQEGHLFEAELSHFSMFDAEKVTFADLLFWADLLKTAEEEDNQEHRERFRPYAEKFGLDSNLVDLLLILDLADVFSEMDRQADSLGVSEDLSFAWGTKGLVEQAILKFVENLGQSVPTAACGHYIQLGVELFELQDLVIGDPDLEDLLKGALTNLTQQCVVTDLTGTWETGSSTVSEVCRFTDQVWLEEEVYPPVLMSIEQSGRTISLSFPNYPEIGVIEGHLLFSGLEDRPYYFTGALAGSDTPDCLEFLESDGMNQVVGEPVCNPFYTLRETEEGQPTYTYNCVPLSCSEINQYTAYVSKDGKSILGWETWSFVASFRAIFPAWVETASITCNGGGDFSATRIF